MEKKTTSKPEPKPKVYVCLYCKELIEAEYIEIPRKATEKYTKRAHKICFDKQQKRNQDIRLLFDYIRDTYFMVNFPAYMGSCLNNLHNYGCKYKNNNPVATGYPYNVLYMAAKKAEKDLLNYITYAEEKGIISDTQHKTNIIIKGIEKYLDSCYAEWKSEQINKEEKNITIVENKDKEQKVYVQLQKNNVLIDFGGLDDEHN